MLVTQSCLTLCNPMDYSQPGSSVHGILQARILQWIAMPSSRGSSQPRNQTRVSCAAGRFFIVSAIRKAQRVKGKQLIILCFAFSCESPVHGICVSTPYCPSPSLFFFPPLVFANSFTALHQGMCWHHPRFFPQPHLPCLVFYF